MITRRKFTSAALASAAAALFVAAPVKSALAANADVKCFGVNKCKGHNDCKTDGNACKGHAKCEGKGFVKMSKKACGDIGGSVNKPKK